MSKRIEFTKIRDVKTPKRANVHDVGTDFFIPNYTEDFFEVLKLKNKNNKLRYQLTFDEEGNNVLEIIIPAGEQINIPSGIKVNILDKNTYLDAQNKSGIASNFHLVVGAKIIDPDYQGEIHINMLNVGNTPVTIKTGMKITQFIYKTFIDPEWVEITVDEYDKIEISDRGDGGFSSSGLK